MTPIDATWLANAARRLRWRHDLAVVAASLAAAFLTGAIALRLGQSVGAALAAGLGIGLLVGFIALPRHRAAITHLALARHINRTAPAAEESAELLLASTDSLPRLAQLQQRRVADKLRALEAAPPLPGGVYYGTLRAALWMTAGAALVIAVPAAGNDTDRFAPNDEDARVELAVAGRMAVRLEAVTIRPPAYTGRATRRTDSWELEVEEGATVHWTFAASQPVAGGRLVTAAGDTAAVTVAGDRLSVSLPATRSTLYRLHLDGVTGESAGFEDHRLLVQPDAPPVLTIIHPDQRTMIQPGDALRLDVEVLARDDHGVDSIAIVATVSKGQGEGVKFREQRLGFTSRQQRDNRGLLLRRTLDLAALGLEPGDELYFHITATDHRTPTPNASRSETVFVTLVDSTRAGIGPGTGVALDVAPDYFRSQRQLIIDTEKLLADQRRLAQGTFMGRSNGLGIDQGLLRLRYGQFMGDEFEGEMPASGREAHADDHEADAAAPARPTPGQVAIPGGAPADLIAELTHDHDDPENATLLAPQVKSMLRDAITAMWSAELHLRLGEPRKSLPFQHRALELLQQIRQDARAYVQRVGFDPPPLEPDRKRLTGNQEEIRAPVLERARTWRDEEPVLRDGLQRLQRLRAGGRPAPGDASQLEVLGQALAQRAVEDAAWLLEPLRALREGIASLTSDGAGCRECL
ncbi:MAG: DUF4175 family protein, partial [Gemmatimonadales bacterium]